MLDFTEDKMRNQQDWPANTKQRQKQKEQESQQQEKKQQQKEDASGSTENPHDDGKDETNDRVGRKDHDEDGADNRSEYDKLRSKYTPEQIALLRALRHEKEYRFNLETNDGTGHLGIKHVRTDTSLSEDDSPGILAELPRP